MTKSTTQFEYLGGHLIHVPVRVGSEPETRFILDTGIGLNLISKKFCEKISCGVIGKHVGKRMSGQVLEVPLSMVPSLTFGSERRENVIVGVFDMSGFPQEFGAIEGFLSLKYFENVPFTIDYRSRTVILETAETLQERRERGLVSRMRVEREGESVSVALPFEIPGAPVSWLEVDTGSSALILNAPFMKVLQVDPFGAGVRRVSGKDETGHVFERFFAEIPGPIHPENLPQLAQSNVRVMFQKIIYDGLIGDAFLNRFAVTYDLRHGEMIFNSGK